MTGGLAGNPGGPGGRDVDIFGGKDGVETGSAVLGPAAAIGLDMACKNGNDAVKKW